MDPSRSKRNRNARRVGIALAAAAIALAGCEFLLRALRPPLDPAFFPGFHLLGLDDEAGGRRMMRRHPIRFFEPVPGATGVFSTDEHGFRGGSHPPRHENLFRVAVIGDSVAMGFGTRHGAGLCGVFEKRLREALPALDVDVVCAACAGYSTLQNVLDLDDRVLPLEPDAVVLALTAWNDSGPAVLWSDSEWARRYSDLRRWRASPLASLRLASLPREFMLLPPASDVEATKEAIAGGKKPYGARVSRDEFRANVARMLDRCAESGARAYVLLLPRREDAEFRDAGPLERLEAARAEAQRRLVPVLDVAPRFPSLDERLFFDVVHPTEEGHRIAGEALAAVLLEDADLDLCDRSARASGPRPALRSVAPLAVSAFGGDALAIEGDGIGAAESPRFCLGNEPLRLDGFDPSGAARVLLPPLPPGALDLEVTTRRGSASLARAVIARGPELRATIDSSRARVEVRSRPGDRAQIFVASRKGGERMQFGRVFGLDRSALLPHRIEQTLGPDGSLALEVPLAAGLAKGSLFVMAMVEPREKDPPLVPLFTEVVEVALGR